MTIAKGDAHFETREVIEVMPALCSSMGEPKDDYRKPKPVP
jgi:hypothetical protein